MRRWNSILFVITQGNLARVLFYAGKLDEADAVARKAAELQPAGAGTHRWQVLIAAQRGDGETALREAQLEPDESFRRFELAVAQYVRGDRAGSRRGTGRPDRQRVGIVWPIKSPRFMLCEVRKIKLSSGYKSHSMITMPECSALSVDPLLRGLRDDPRYKNLLAKVGLPTTS